GADAQSARWAGRGVARRPANGIRLDYEHYTVRGSSRPGPAAQGPAATGAGNLLWAPAGRGPGQPGAGFRQHRRHRSGTVSRRAAESRATGRYARYADCRDRAGAPRDACHPKPPAFSRSEGAGGRSLGSSGPVVAGVIDILEARAGIEPT